MPIVIDAQKCDGCGTCLDWCPTDAISIVDEKAQLDEDECIDCGACIEACPNGAISQQDD